MLQKRAEKSRKAYRIRRCRPPSFSTKNYRQDINRLQKCLNGKAGSGRGRDPLKSQRNRGERGTSPPAPSASDWRLPFFQLNILCDQIGFTILRQLFTENSQIWRKNSPKIANIPPPICLKVKFKFLFIFR